MSSQYKRCLNRFKDKRMLLLHYLAKIELKQILAEIQVLEFSRLLPHTLI